MPHRLYTALAIMVPHIHIRRVRPIAGAIEVRADRRYRRFSNPKSRAVDQQFIDLFDLRQVWLEVLSERGGGIESLPSWGMLTLPRLVGNTVRRDNMLMWGL